MALGIKSQPGFEKGDLLYAFPTSIDENIVYFNNPSDEADPLTIPSVAGQPTLLGIITDEEVNDTNLSGYYWVEFRTANNANSLGYVTRDVTLYEARANAEFNYPEKEKRGFNWTGVLSGINSVTSAILGIFNNAQREASPIGGAAGNNPSLQTRLQNAQGQESFLQRYGIGIVIGILALVLGIVIFRKPKEKPTAAVAKPTLKPKTA